MNKVYLFSKKIIDWNALLRECMKKVDITVNWLCTQQYVARQSSWTYFRRRWSISKLSCHTARYYFRNYHYFCNKTVLYLISASNVPKLFLNSVGHLYVSAISWFWWWRARNGVFCTRCNDAVLNIRWRYICWPIRTRVSLPGRNSVLLTLPLKETTNFGD